MLQYKHKDDDGFEEIRLEAATSHTSFEMKKIGKYVVDVFYADRPNIVGPPSTFVVNYVVYPECGAWCVICFMMVAVLFSILLLFCFLWFVEKRMVMKVRR